MDWPCFYIARLLLATTTSLGAGGIHLIAGFSEPAITEPQQETWRGRGPSMLFLLNYACLRIQPSAERALCLRPLDPRPVILSMVRVMELPMVQDVPSIFVTTHYGLAQITG